ncbi:LysR family transcriptional regulator [Stappia taiwanensis]|uniref:LysR family transcriptional regulator n=1 Tax=Stappia taiwanensis TaxID=992267 RepID=A0A838XQX8_9HYPH|nr:LysR family transcriptional regulator [Stappia taiwanensis]MBA4610986.1 LysR family transcriptional regulator [Stappia taiwanensis]GGE94259.1 LysR family transcriptional regulator [Stappia taiwanensis]
MNWDDLRIFLAVARAGQLLAAARALGVNHATVARRLSALEEDLAVKLVDRRTTGSLLTPAGERFRATAERIEAEMLGARADIGGGDIAISGTVRIGAPDGFGVAFLAPRLGTLAARHPDLTLQLVPVPRAVSLSRREADIAITVERPEHGRLVARKLVDYSLGLYASKAYLERAGMPETAQDLRTHALVGYVEDLVYASALAYADEIDRAFRPRFEIASALGQTEAVRAGAGIGILHAFIARRDPKLVPVLPEKRISRSYWLVLHESLREMRRVRVVADFIASEVERERTSFT